MEINTKTVNDVTVVEVAGEIDGKTAPQAQQSILPLIQPGCKLLLDMSGITYMSSAGLRVLLSTYREISSNKGTVVLAGLSDEIQDIMSATGFLEYFTLCPTVDAAISELEK